MSIDGSPISAADRARMEAEEALLHERQRKAVWVIAGGATNVADARLLLDILGLDSEVIRDARDAAKREAGTRPLNTSTGAAVTPDRKTARPRKRTAA